MAAGRIVIPPLFPARDRNARLVPGALLGVYTNGTTTKASIYSDEALTTPLTNPVEANSSGHFPAIWAEAGTADVPTLYTVSISGPNGESIANPATFDDWQPSLDADTAALALAEAAADAAEAAAAAAAADLADMLAVVASGDDAAAIAARAAKAANLSDLSDRQAATGNLLFKQLTDPTGAAQRDLRSKLSDFINVKDFGAVGDGVTDDTDALRNAIEYAHGRPVYLPGGDYLITSKIEVEPIPWVDVSGSTSKAVGAFAPGMWLFGDGMVETRIQCRVANDVMFYCNVTNPTPVYAFRAQMGMRVENLAIVGGGGSVAASTAFEIYNAYQVQFSQVHIRSLSGTAIKLVNGAFSDDGWNCVSLQSLWIENCGSAGAGWGIDATGSSGRNEGSFTHLKNVFIQGCGKNQYFSLTGLADSGGVATVTVNLNQMPAASPTATAHPFVEGDRIKLFGVRRSITLGASPLATVIGSPIVTVTYTAHGLSVGDQVTLSGATAVGGITPDGNYQISSVATNSFTIIHSSSATSTASGGGSSVVAITPMPLANDTVYQVGPSPTATTFTLYTDAATPAAVSAATWGTWVSDLATAATINTDPITTHFNETTSAGVDIANTTVTITHTAHGAVAGDLVTIAGATAVGGLTISGQYRVVATGDVNGLDTANKYRITAASAATSSASGGGASVTAQYTYRSTIHGEVSYYEPQSGAMRSKGQLVKLESCGFTVNYNVAHYVPGGAGGNIGLICDQVTWENNYRRHIFVKGGLNYYFIGCQFHGNNQAGLRQWRLAEFDASENTITQVLWQNTKVRAKECPATAFKYSGANASPNNVRVRGIIWSDFDYARQKRFVGIQFDPIQQDLGLSWTSTTLMALRPNQVAGYGNKSPIRLRGPINDSGTGVASMTGEWAAFQPTSNGGVFCYNTVTGLSGGGALANSTVYNIYLYDNDGVGAMIPSLTAPVIDAEHGYMVMDGDPSMLWVGRAVTDGSAQWSNSGTQYLNPLLLPATGQGTYGSIWYSDIDRKLRIKSSVGLPSSIAGGTYDYWPTYETSVAYDPPSLAAGATTTTDVTVTCGAGDYCSGVGFSTGWGGLTATGCVKAANTVTVTLTNNTGSTIDLASGSIRVAVQRR